MGPRRVFESVLAAVVALCLLGILGRYVLATNRLLASSHLSEAYHAMRTSILLARAHCQVNVKLHCAQEYLAASPEGIALAAGLQKGMYTLDYWPGGLFVYLRSQAGNPGCRIVYTAPAHGNAARLVVNTEHC